MCQGASVEISSFAAMQQHCSIAQKPIRTGLLEKVGEQ